MFSGSHSVTYTVYTQSEYKMLNKKVEDTEFTKTTLSDLMLKTVVHHKLFLVFNRPGVGGCSTNSSVTHSLIN